jgi:glyceraldehyde 3-phosphate dehydrogenase
MMNYEWLRLFILHYSLFISHYLPKNSMNIAINGTGRIGRNLLRLLVQQGHIERVVALNDVMSLDNLAYLLRYDSVRGPFPGEVSTTDTGLIINGHPIAYSAESEPGRLPWHDHNLDLVVEATGRFVSMDALRPYLNLGSRVLLTTTGQDMPSHIWGFNHTSLSAQDRVISPAGCTTNCLTPLIHLTDQRWGVESVLINVLHAYSSRQHLIDGPYGEFRRGRSAAQAIVPVAMRVVPTIETLLPHLTDRMSLISTRIPIVCGALADICLITKDFVGTATEANAYFTRQIQTDWPGILGTTTDPIVSADILGNPLSALLDTTLTATAGRQLRLMAWFDNEWGFVNRLHDFVRLVDGWGN